MEISMKLKKSSGFTKLVMLFFAALGAAAPVINAEATSCNCGISGSVRTVTISGGASSCSALNGSTLSTDKGTATLKDCK